MRIKTYEKKLRIQPRGGRSNTVLQYELMDALEKAGANILPITIDSNTRLQKFEKAKELYEVSKVTGSETLNGYPLLAVDLDEARDMLSKFSTPLSLRHGSPVAEVLVARALLLGIDEIEGGPLTYLLPYSRTTKLKDAFKSWQEVDKMCSQSVSGLGNPVLRESFGVLTAVLVHPYIALLVSFLEAIFAGRSGIKHFMIGLQATGNLEQDKVQFEVAKKITEILKKDLLHGVEIYYAYHHWMGPFPKNELSANEMIDICNLSAFLNKVDKVVVKTAVEAYGIPTNKANVNAVRRTSLILDKLGSKNFYTFEMKLASEIELLQAEVLLGIQRIIYENNDLSLSMEQAIELGWIDLMFSPHSKVKKLIRVCRDNQGWLRFFDSGKLGLTKEFIKHEKERLGIRLLKLTSDKIEQDIEWPVMNSLVQNWARDFHSID